MASSLQQLIMATENYFFMVFSFLGFIITILPFPWQWRGEYIFIIAHANFLLQCSFAVIGGRNSGICIFRYWNATWCLILFIDAIIWNKNLIDHAPVWCAIGIFITTIYLLYLITRFSGSLLCSRDRGHIGCGCCDFSQRLLCCFSRIRKRVRNDGAAPLFSIH